MQSQKIREKFFNFFEKRGHKILPSFSLIPENDPSVLFISAGMQPLVPFLLGEPHPQGKRLANIQKCLRTNDIEAVGDNFHLTFFEMMGYWSLGDYFKKESIHYSFDFFTKELGIEKDKLFVTVFEGNKEIPQDIESAQIWEEDIGIPKEKIYFLSEKDNFWIAGDKGPCGPCTEIFYDTEKEKCSNNCSPGCDCGKYIEIGNNVFMEYNKREDGSYEKLGQKNVDVGLGLERIAAVLQKKDNVFETDLFLPIYKKIGSSGMVPETALEPRFLRRLTDHIKASCFLISEGILPGKEEREYVLRRLLRWCIRYARLLKFKDNWYLEPIKETINIYKDIYPELKKQEEKIITVFQNEEEKFKKTLEAGIRELHKIFEWYGNSSLKAKEFGGGKIEFDVFKNNNKELGKKLFFIYQTYGFPIELSFDEWKYYFNKILSDLDKKEILESFNKEKEKHREISRRGLEKRFKGGLADTSYETAKLHTATHLLLAALRKVLGEHIIQKGSNITPERLRFDFSHPEKLTDDQIKRVEELVNQKIKEGLTVHCEEMSLREAKEKGALGVFEERYKDKVKVYTIGKGDEIFSKEICGGPHVKNTLELGKFKVIKEESAGVGIRRIKAILEKEK